MFLCHACREFCFIFPDTVSLCSLCCPGTCSVDQAGLEFTEICLPLPLKCQEIIFLFLFFLLLLLLLFFLLFDGGAGFLCVVLAVPLSWNSLQVEQAGLQLRYPPASAFLVLALKAHATIPSINMNIFKDQFSLCSPGCQGTHCIDQANLKNSVMD